MATKTIPRTQKSINLASLRRRLYSEHTPIATPQRSSTNPGEILHIAAGAADDTRRTRILAVSDTEVHIHRVAKHRKSSSLNAGAEELSWNIIEREISEWQYTCRTGQPYCWSANFRNERGSIQPLLFGDANRGRWREQLDEHFQPSNAASRRAKTSDTGREPRERDDLAHLIAVQLLSACFTLSPYDLQRSKNELHVTSPLISALRMHTHFRYSPCFGHQQRNTSPISSKQLDEDYLNGAAIEYSPMAVNPSSFAQLSAKRSNSAFNQAGHARFTADPSVHSPGLSFVGAPTRDGRRHVKSDNHHTQARRCLAICNDNDGGNDTCHSSTNLSEQRHHWTPNPSAKVHSSDSKLVLKRFTKGWRTVRRRFGGSSPEQSTVSATSATSGKARRRRAQERGEIESSSMDSTQHCNTPHSRPASPSSHSEERATYPRPLSPRHSRSGSQTREAQQRPLLDSDRHAESAPAILIHDTASPRTVRDPEANVTPARNFSIRRRQARRGTRSMLSEVCTPQDFISADATDCRSPLSQSSALPGYEMDDQGSEFPFPVEAADACPVENDETQERLVMQRTSSSGTQIFTPTQDGIELNGYSVAPSGETWNRPRNVKGKARERSFL